MKMDPMRNRPWLNWTALHLAAFVAVIVLITIGLRLLLSGHGQGVTTVSYIINIALFGLAIYVIGSWAGNRDRHRDATR